MVSLITSPNAHNLKTRTSSVLEVVTNDRFWGFKDLKMVRTRSGILCKGSLENDLKISRNSNDFQTQKELLDAGRVDLVGAIINKGDCGDENGCDCNEVDDNKDLNTRFDLSCSTSHQCDSFSCRSIEIVIHEDAWKEGILHRSEKDRNFSFSTSMQEDRHCIYDSSKVNGGQRVYESVDVDLTATTLSTVEKPNRHAEIDPNERDDIKSRLQQMQLELSLSLCLLRSIQVKEKNNLSNGHKSSPSELQRLSDTWEFHDNEHFNVRDRLKSVRAELAVSEGKLASSIMYKHQKFFSRICWLDHSEKDGKIRSRRFLSFVKVVSRKIRDAALREKLEKIIGSDYYKITPEMKATDVVTAEAAGSYSLHASVPVEITVPSHEQMEDHATDFQTFETLEDQPSPVEDSLKQHEAEAENSTETQVHVEQVETPAGSTEYKEQSAPRRSYNQRGNGRAGGGRSDGRGYRNGNGNARGGRSGGRGGPYQKTGRNQYHEQPGDNYYQRNYYGGGGRGGQGNGGGSNGYNHRASGIELAES